MMTREEIEEIIEDAIFWDGLDEAIIGTAERINLLVVAYDIEKILEILMKDIPDDEIDDLEDGETLESRKYTMALEYYDYNIAGCWVGDNTPVHLWLNNK